MASDDYTYGKIFVEADPAAVRSFLSALLGTDPTSSVWVRDGVEVEVRRNPDVGAADGFVGWPAFVELVPESDDVTDRQVLDVAREVFRGLLREFGQAVAAADYEDMLSDALIEGRDVHSEMDLHRILEQQLDLGEHYGRNLAALRDRLMTDVPRPVRLIWRDSAVSRERLGEELFATIVAMFSAVADQDAGYGWDDRFMFHLE